MARKPASPALQHEALSYLDQRGLSKKDASAMGLIFCSSEELDARLKQKYGRGGIWIPYRDTGTLKLNCFGRARFLEAPTGFAGLVEKQRKFAQPQGSGNHFY